VRSREYVDTAIAVRAPATSANLGPGFDALGLALRWHDDVEVRVTGSELAVDVSGEGADSVARDETHLVVRSMRSAFDAIGVGQPDGLVVRCRNRIPHGRGLGSSAAAIVTGVVAARALVPDGAERLDEGATLRLAAELEGHPDNVAACLLGGLTVAWTEADGARALALSTDVRAVAMVPPESVSTEAARGMLPERVPHVDAARNAGRAALLVAALMSATRPEVLLAGTDDRLHQAYRAPAMPDSYALVERLRADGIAAIVSGAGPTVLALLPADVDTEPLRYRVPDGWRSRPLEIDAQGAHLRE
jgi:homoserine kinase